MATNETNPMRFAFLENYRRQGFTQDTADAYLPHNYEAVFLDSDVVIKGRDDHGWTLDGYVIPRLASGNYFAKEIVMNDQPGYMPGDFGPAKGQV